MQRALMARLPQDLHTVSRPVLPPDASPGHHNPSLNIEGPTVQDIWGVKKTQSLILAQSLLDFCCSLKATDSCTMTPSVGQWPQVRGQPDHDPALLNPLVLLSFMDYRPSS